MTDFSALEISLEEGRHLCVAGPSVSKDGEVDGKAKQVDQERQDDEPDNPGDDVSSQFNLARKVSTL